MSATAAAPVTARPRRTLFVCLVLVTALSALDQTIVATALPAVTAELGAPWRVSWIVTAYALAMTASLTTAGALGDRFGRRRTLLACITLFVLASLACACAGSVEQLAAARFAQGAAGAGLLVLPQAVVADAVPARQRAAYLGPLGAVFAVATVAGPLLGGWLTDLLGWRLIFGVNLPLGAAAALLALRAVPASSRTPGAQRVHRFDTVGAALVALAATALVLVTTAAGEGAPGGTVVAGAAGSAVLVAAALAWERRPTQPVFPVRALTGRTPLLCCLLALTAGLGLFGMIAYVPMWTQGAYGVSATTAGLMLLPTTVGITVGMNLSGRLVGRLGRWRVFPRAGSALATLAAAGLALGAGSGGGSALPLPLAALLLALLGLGAGLFMQVVVVVAQDAAPVRSVGAVTSALAFVREIGVTVGAAGLGALAAHGLAAGGTDAASYGDAFRPVFAAAACCFAVGLLCAVALPPHRLGTETPTTPERAGT
ncbi:MFS transporter [Streptomyces sp. NBC_00356]|uniref:MFS transporter n=1 Tax=Streptomyces sp. NBC_00356 TaxID=2975724 RepID=UPI002E2700CA